jgi:hypothetical protein
MPEHFVEQGECVGSIAEQYGFSWKALWNHGENSALKQKRKNPNILYPGDRVFIPDQELGEASAATNQRHKFKLKDVPSTLQLRFLSDGQPRKDEEYRIQIDDQPAIRDQTDGDGRIKRKIPPGAECALITFPATGEVFKILLGALDPIDEVSGIKGRLTALGFPCGDINQTMDAATEAAIRAFQMDNQLKASGKVDDATRSKLQSLYGS